MSRNISSQSAAAGTAGLAAAVGFLLITAAPAPALADHDFGVGFEDELGRIAAHAVVGVGVGLLHHAIAPAHYERPAHYGHGCPHYKHPKRAHGRHYRQHARGHGYGHDRGYGHGRRDRHPGHGYRRGIPP